MADTKKYGWNVQIDGVQYLVEYMKGSIFINGGEAFKLRSLERTGTLRKDKQLSYTVPLAGKELNLVISAVSGYQSHYGWNGSGNISRWCRS